MRAMIRILHTSQGPWSRTLGNFLKDRHGVSARSQMHSHTFNNPVVNSDII